MADAQRIQTRIAWLNKNRPNDPEIRQLQAKLKTVAPAPAQPPAASPSPTTPPAAGAPAPEAPQINNARVQTRIDWLKKNRPNDPEIKQLEQRLGSATPQTSPPMVQGDPLSQVAEDYAGDVAAQSGLNTAFQPTMTDRPIQADLMEARRQQQGELESYLGRDLDAAYSTARERLEQEMFNRGIPVGSQQFTDRMRMLDDNFARQRGDIRAQALQFGGQELERTFNVGETRRINELGEQTTINKTNLGNVQGLTDIDIAYKTLAEQRRQANMQNQIQRQQLARSGGGGGGASAQPVVNSPFVG